MAKAQTSVQLEQLQVLKEAGYEIPEALVSLVQQAEWNRLGVAQVWKCVCPEQYESLVSVSSVNCKKGHLMAKIWVRPLE